MDQGNDITLTLWLFGAVGAVITMLLGWIAFMIREDKKQSQVNYAMHDKRIRKHDKILIKHDKKFDKQHNEIKALIEIMRPKTS